MRDTHILLKPAVYADPERLIGGTHIVVALLAELALSAPDVRRYADPGPFGEALDEAAALDHFTGELVAEHSLRASGNLEMALLIDP
jgi:hypothetical protein